MKKVESLTKKNPNMAFKVFYAWQSDRVKDINQNFISDCLKETLKRLKRKFADDSPEFILDRDTKGIPGFPDIPATIYKKIENCDIFIGDLTIIGHIEKEDGSKEPQLNNNVFGELNYALGKIGEERIINIMNTFFGKPDVPGTIPFDVAQRRFPITYELSAKDIPNYKEEKEKLIANLYDAILLIFMTEHERQKKEYDPFETWHSWNETTPSKFDYEVNDYIIVQFNSIKNSIRTSGSVTRVLGLSGLGKTKMLLECFRPGNIGMTPEVSNRVLYANMNDCDENAIGKKIKDLYVNNNGKKVIILDNCTLQQLEKYRPLFQGNGCEMSLITISPEPSESDQAIDITGKTAILKLESREFKSITKQLLENNFKDLTSEDIELIVDYSNGLPLYADLMGSNKDIAKDKPGELTNDTILAKLLGPLYKDEQKKQVILATAIFSRFGYFDQYATQYKEISKMGHICPLAEADQGLKERFFKKVCEEMIQRGLLEKIGFSLSFRPTPLAVKLAEEWWSHCTVAKFREILPFLKENDLVEKFCQQFRLLKHVEDAKEIVADLCEGVFNSAEVLNTEEGSRLFRSFVYVNPVACLKSLENAFGGLTTAQLLEVSEGRRNIIWSLEQLCFRKDTFNNAVRILASFAVAENEEIANNATQQFLQLFHIFLPATIVDLHTRMEVIYFCLKSGDEYLPLGIKAAKRALKSEHFNRMGGSEVQGDSAPLKDYVPTQGEIREYWSISLNILNEQLERAEFSALIVDSLYGMLSFGGSQIILPIFKELIDKNEIDWLVARNQILFILRTGKIYDSNVIDTLTALVTKITPDDFVSRLKMYVVKPSSEDYFKKANGEEQKYLPNKVKELALEFYQDENLWPLAIPHLLQGYLGEGLNFGKNLGELAQEGKANMLISLFLSEYKRTGAENANPMVLMGIFRTLNYPELVIRFYEQAIQDSSLQTIAYRIAGNVDLPYEQVQKLVDLTISRNLDSQNLLCYSYGWGLRQLNSEQAIDVLDKITKIDEKGCGVALSIAHTWGNNDEQIWSGLRSFLHSLIINFSDCLLKYSNRSNDMFYLSEEVKRLLKYQHDVPLAEKILELIIKENNNNWEGSFGWRNDEFNLVEILQEDYFHELWSALKNVYSNIDQYGTVAFNFRDLLGSKHDYYMKSDGLLFKGGTKKFDEIFEWVKSNEKLNRYWISELIPVFNQNTDDQSKWHPFALRFINEMGDDQNVLDGISAKIGSYSWVGSLKERHQQVKQMFEELINHPKSLVKSWAIDNLEAINTKIKWEENREAEWRIS
jgi:hypothetical protein